MASKNPMPRNSETCDNICTIELRRTNSMIKPPIEFVSKDAKDVSDNNHNVNSYVFSKTKGFLSNLKQFKVEVIMFLYMFSYVLRSISSTSMIMDKVCKVHLKHSEDICFHLKDHVDIKNQVEKLANNYSLGHTLVQMVPSAILSCFIGAWSDKYGRKMPTIIALLGSIIDGFGSTLCAFYFNSRVEFYFIPAIFTGISGGFIAIMTVLYSYASDITKFEKRTMKYAFVEISFSLAMPLGQLAGGWIFKYGKYVPVFITSTVGHLFGLAWVLFVLEETTGLSNTDSWRTKFMSLWSMKPVMESVQATLKRRPNQGRKQILLLIVSMSFVILTFASTPGISFIYAYHMFNWDNTTYSTVIAIFSVINNLCLLVSVFVFKRMNLGDPTLGVVGTASLLFKNICMGLASSKKEIFYVAHLLGLLSGLSTLAGRSRISKVASKNDLGKIFAFLTTAECLLPIIASAIVSQVFNATLDTYPGLIYIILGIVLVVPLIVFIWLGRLPPANYEDMHNNQELTDKTTSSASSSKMELPKK